MNIIQDLIPSGRINRPGTKNTCTSITIHETANTAKGANAKAHAAYIKTIKDRTSWHYTVDEKEIYQHIPDAEKSYHTSRGIANESSIAIEICVNEDGDFVKAVENAVWLVRHLMKKHDIAINNVKGHRDWTGKNCPATLVSAKWDNFIASCAAKEESKSKYITVEELKAMGYEGITFN